VSPLSHLTFCSPIKSNLYFYTSPETVISEPAFHIILIFTYHFSNPYSFAYIEARGSLQHLEILLLRLKNEKLRQDVPLLSPSSSIFPSLVGDERHAPVHLPPGNESHSTIRWLGPRLVVGVLEQRKISFSEPEQNSTFQSAARPHTDWAISTPPIIC
jgi:hypothetical protein